MTKNFDKYSIFSQLSRVAGKRFQNKLAKARKMRKPPGTLGLKKFGLGNLWSKKFGPKILAYLQYTFGKYTFRKYTFGKYTFRKYIFFREYTFSNFFFDLFGFSSTYSIFWAQTFSIQNLPNPNFFKSSVPGGLRIFRAFASLF